MQATLVICVTISLDKASSVNRLGAWVFNQLVMLSVHLDGQRFIKDGVPSVCVEDFVALITRLRKNAAAANPAG